MPQAVEIDEVPAPPLEALRRKELSGLVLTVMPVAGLIWLYWPILNNVAQDWFRNGDASICAAVPLISAALLYARRERLRKIPVAPTAWGIVLTAVAIAPVSLGPTFKHNVIASVAMLPVAIAGFVLALRGKESLRAVAVPILFLFLIRPVPTSPTIDIPVQLASARISTAVLHVVGVPVTQQGTLLMLGDDRNLAIAPECDGIRSATAMLILGALYAYLLAGSWQRRLVLLLCAVPFAYVGNIFRISGETVAMWRFTSWVEPHFSRFDSWFGLVVFLIPMAMLYIAAGALGCRQFREIG